MASLKLNSDPAQLLRQILVGPIDDAVEADRPRPADIRGEIVHEHAFRRLGLGQAMTVPKKFSVRLAYADLMREDQRIEMPQHVGELREKPLGMNCVGIAAEKDTMILRKLRDQVAHFGVGRKDILNGLDQKLGMTIDLPKLTYLLQKVRNREMSALHLVLQRAFVHRSEHRFFRQRRMGLHFAQRSAMIEEPNDVAEIENDRFHI